MMEQILNSTLAPKHKIADLELIETDDHLLELRTRNAEVIARFSATGATIQRIHKEAEKWLEQHKTE